jgi:16S rRNA (cytidine1402-2'-O)-methyltransferase
VKINLGILYICATPIGNLEDVSIRLLKTLRSVDLIACEDTRQTIKLLNKYKIKKKMISYHEYSDPKREDYIVDLLLQGKKIALLSDAGMPGISDPGEKLLQKVLSQPVEIEIIPGPSAAISAR